MNPIGFMQGRLSPKVGDRIQAFPWDHWQEEFHLATQHGFPVLEWVFESERFQENPIWTEEGQAQMQSLSSQTGTRVESVCADYFMERPLFGVGGDEQERSGLVLERLIECCARLGVSYLEIPLVDNSSLRSASDKEGLVDVVARFLPKAVSLGVTLTLETDLAPQAFRQLLETFDSPNLRANYDMGNSASLGYDPDEEMDAIGSWIANVHVKDRVLHGGTVPLGAGDAHLPRVFRGLRRIGYSGTYILQTARQPDDVQAACGYRDQVLNLMQQTEHSNGS